jgi:hypothetical protein
MQSEAYQHAQSSGSCITVPYVTQQLTARAHKHTHLRSQTTRLPPSKQMKQTTSSSFLFTGFTGAGTGAAPSLFFGGLPLFLFTGATAAAGGCCCWGGAAAPMIDPRNCWSSKPSPWRGGGGSFFVAAAAAGGVGCRCGWGAALRAGGGGGSGTGGSGGRRSSGGHSASPGESTSAPGPVSPSMDQQPHPRLSPKTLTLARPPPPSLEAYSSSPRAASPSRPRK